MGVKYRISYRAHDDIAWRVDISKSTYSGEIIPVKGVSASACTISYNGGTDAPYEAIINSKAAIQVYQQGQIDILELQESQDRDFAVSVYRNDVLFWKGFLIGDGIQQTFKATPYVLSITATDGLSLLEGIKFTGLNNWALPTGIHVRSPLSYFREIFTYRYLNNHLPIRWVNTLECTAFPGIDAFAGSVQWSPRGDGYTDNQGNSQTCLYIIEEMLKSFQARIFQADGVWKIQRINDVTTGVWNWKQIDTTFGGATPPVLTTGTNAGSKLIGKTGYPFILEDQLFTVKPGLKAVTVTYNSNIRENILPNGNQDIVDTVNIRPLYWGIPLGVPPLSVSPPITKQAGYSTHMEATSGQPSEFILITNTGTGATLPIDTKTLFKRFNFGFTFMPQAGFAVDANNIITTPLEIILTYRSGNKVYQLTEFGFWSETIGSPISILVANLKFNDVAQIDFNRNQEIFLPTPPVDLVAGALSVLTITFRVSGGMKYTLDNIYIKVDQNNDIYSSTLNSSSNTETEEVELQISSSFSGFMLSNYMTAFYNSSLEYFFKDGTYYTGSLTGLTANAMMRFRYKSSLIYNGSMNVRGKSWSFDEVYDIQTLTGKKFLPLNASYNTETAEVNLIAMECRNDVVSLTEKHYGSNDDQLSN